MLEGSEPGDYELGGVEVNVKRLKEIIPSFQVQNPPFRTDLLNLE